MIAMRLKQAKAGFFDRPRVLAAVSTGERQVLSKFGAFVRQRARSSIKPRRTAAPPGRPPSSHTGLLKRNILFAYDQVQRGIVIGPVALNQAVRDAPRLLELGGTTVLRRGGRQVRAHYRQRPYMRPAFAHELQALPPLWRNSVR